MENLKKKSVLLLPVILLSYFVVGFPDGAFTISWLGIEYDLNLTITHSGYILVGYSVTYTLAGVILSRLNRFIKLQTIYFWGLIIMGAGFISLALSINFLMALIAIAIYGFGTGAMTASMNSYMAKHFTARHNNWMHCFWGGGIAISPIIMAYMMDVSGWSAGYFVITGILSVVAIMLLVSMYKKIWVSNDTTVETITYKTIAKNRHFTKKWHQIVEILTFFFLGGTDYTLVFFTGMVLIERGFEDVAIFSAVYYISMTSGRMFFGWMAKWLKELYIIRIGVLVSIIGILVLHFFSHILGMALVGFGLGPLLPTLVSDTSNRFSDSILSKIVGYELASFGAGIAVLFFFTSQILEHITLEALFPIGLLFVLLVFICNEILERAIKSERSKHI